MVRGKLILICQSRGEFVTKDDGTMLYTGGEAHALDISPETVFDDLKHTLAETCNLEYKSLSIKYFLPGNRRTLITLANDKDLKRMYDFHGDAVTADIFLTGREGFDPVEFDMHANGRNGMASRAAPASPATTKGAATLKDVPVAIATPSGSAIALNAPIRTPTRAANSSKQMAGRSIADGLFEVSVADGTAHSPDTIDMSASPADTVKKRRRTASWRSGANGLTIVTVADNLEETGNTTSHKRHAKNQKAVPVADDLEQDTWLDDINYDLTPWDPNGTPSALIASWKNGITGEGQDFKNVVEFRDALQKYAIAHRFAYKMRKNDAKRVSVVCAAEGCPWRIHASWVPSDLVFRIKKVHETHTCGGESWKSSTPAKNWLVKLQEEFAKSRGLKVLFSSDTLFEVHDDSIHVVDVDKRQCSCGMWKPTGIPCRHGIAVFNCTNRSVYDYCSAYFTADSFRLAYSESIKPASTIVLPSNDDIGEPEDEQVLPPSLTRPPAMVQQKKPRRCKSQGIIRRSVCCTKCKGVGHNKATCKEITETPEIENGNALEIENGNALENENGNAPENENAFTSS
ncbi:Phox/Bem1p [Corchorus capsularis]|uniref:Phox/Bem1p n=1 Tax=Corchorus capsularis TaxID=210143 RepID=A0A1R3HS48_COCAP|nr:Phox/Bem1p [Corchorus capsularis]